MADDHVRNAPGRRCILTGEPLTEENNSRAHVIPSALGGRLKPWDVLSRNANTLLGDTVDKLLIDALHPIMVQLDGSRDRGSNPAVEMEDGQGGRYRVAFNEPVRPAAPSYRETEEADRTLISIEARTMKEMRTLLGRVRSRVPGFEVDEAIKHAKVVRSWPSDGTLKLELEVGPRRTFPGIFVAASVFAASRGFAPHPDLRGFVKAFDVEQPGPPPDTFNFYGIEPWATAPGKVTHKVALVGDPRRGKALVFVELFNILEIAVLIPFDGENLRVESYGVDVLSGAEVPVGVDAAALLARPWEPSHDLEPALWKIIEERVGRVVGIAQGRGADALIRRQVGEIESRLAAAGQVTAASLLDALEVTTEFTVLELQRPNLPRDRAREIAEAFAATVGSLGALLPQSRRAGFDSGAEALIRRVASASNSDR